MRHRQLHHDIAAVQGDMIRADACGPVSCQIEGEVIPDGLLQRLLQKDAELIQNTLFTVVSGSPEHHHAIIEQEHIPGSIFHMQRIAIDAGAVSGCEMLLQGVEIEMLGQHIGIASCLHGVSFLSGNRLFDESPVR